MKILYKKNKRLKYTSKYNVKLYKKCLSFKLLKTDSISDQPNLICLSDAKAPLNIVKYIYARKEVIPLRLLRFFFFLNQRYYLNKNVKYLLGKRLSVYNGKKAKMINVHRGFLEVTLRCKFKFGELIFTRARYKYKSKAKKKSVF